MYLRTVYSDFALVNGTALLNINFLLALLFGWPWTAVFVTVIVLLTSIIILLKSHKIDLNIEVLNVISSSLLYVSRGSTFILTQFFSSI